MAVNLAMEQATVEFDPERATIPELLEAVDDSGYKAGLALITLNIGGMTCAACVSHVGNALREVDGVISASVNLATEQATVEYVPGLAALTDMKAMVDDAGYTVEGVDDEGAEEGEERLARTREVRALTRKVIIAGAVGAVMMVTMYIPLETLGLTSFQLNLILWALATPVAVLDWGNLLSERVGGPQAPHLQHEHPHRHWDQRGVRVQYLPDLLRRILCGRPPGAR